jgi:hypothetical protein
MTPRRPLDGLVATLAALIAILLAISCIPWLYGLFQP